MEVTGGAQIQEDDPEDEFVEKRGKNKRKGKKA